MAAAKKNGRRTKGLKKTFLFFLGGCFGISNKVSAERGDGKSVKKVSGSHSRALPVKIPMPPEMGKSSKGILVMKDEEKKSQIIALPQDELMSNYKRHDVNSGKNKNKDKSNPTLTGQMKRIEKQTSVALEKLSNPTKLSHSVSMPPSRKKPVVASGGEKGKTGRVGGEIDPKVGAVIIMVTLIVMLIWGKMCAILSTAAWFYFLPRFTARMDNHRPIKIKTGDHLVDLDSWEYKKNVVLRGLLDRN